MFDCCFSCFNDTGIINKYIDKSNIVGQRQSAAKREKQNEIKSLDKKLTKINKRLNKKKIKFSKRTICAYVTFNDAEECANCLSDYPNTFLSKLCMPRRLRFRNKYRIKVDKAPEPSEIIYENMKYSKFNVRIRRMITFVLAFVTILVSCGMTLSAAVYRKSNLESEVNTSVDDQCIQYTTNNLEDGTLLTDEETSCLCAKLTLSELKDHSIVCSDYISNLLISNLLTGLSSIIIVIINIGLKFVSRSYTFYILICIILYFVVCSAG